MVRLFLNEVDRPISAIEIWEEIDPNRVLSWSVREGILKDQLEAGRIATELKRTSDGNFITRTYLPLHPIERTRS